VRDFFSLCLHEPTPNTNKYLGRIHAQFLLAAVFSVFWYLITFPTSATFTRDLKTLEDIAGLFAELNKPNEEGQSFPPFYLARTFIEKLVSLARHSLPKIAGQ
jgi:hypothetical protein